MSNNDNDHGAGVDPVTRPPRQWSRRDLESTYAAGRADLVADALKAGQLADVLAGHDNSEGDPA